MSAPATGARRGDRFLTGGAVLLILCCAVGPAVLGATAGLLGGWFGIACAALIAASLALVLHRRGPRANCG